MWFHSPPHADTSNKRTRCGYVAPKDFDLNKLVLINVNLVCYGRMHFALTLDRYIQDDNLVICLASSVITRFDITPTCT